MRSRNPRDVVGCVCGTDATSPRDVRDGESLGERIGRPVARAEQNDGALVHGPRVVVEEGVALLGVVDQLQPC